MPSSSAPSTVSNSASSPAAWPSVRLQAPLLAHRPLPSITHADVGGDAASDRCPRAERSSGRRYRRTLPPSRWRRSDRYGRRRARAAIGEGGRGARRRSTAALPRRRRGPRPGQREMAEAVAAGHRRQPPSRRAGRHRHRQDPRLPRAGDRAPASRSSWPPPPRRCRTSSPARTCRSSPSTSTRPFDLAVLKGRSNYVCLQRVREVATERRPGLARARRASAHRPSSRSARSAPLGGRDRTPATGPSSTFEPSHAGVGGGQRRSAGVPGRHALPDGRRRASPSRPATRGRRRRRRRRQHPPLRPRPRERRRDPARARRRGDRRGPPARGRHLRHVRARLERRRFTNLARSPRRSWPTRHHRRPRAGRQPALADVLADDVGRRLRGRSWTSTSPTAVIARPRQGRGRSSSAPAHRCPTRARATSRPASSGPSRRPAP